MDKFSRIVPMRFRIHEAYLRDLAVSFSPFSYEQDCKNFLASMEQFQSSDHPENPPYRRFNTVLTALAPTLTHPFESRRNVNTGQYERQMLVVGIDVARRPQPEQISDLAYEWGKQWGLDRFTKTIKGSGHDAYKRLLDRLRQPRQHWFETDAASLFLNLNTETQLGYRAIPGVLSSRLAGRESTIHGKKVIWRLMQDGNQGLAVLSNPFQAQYEDPVLQIVKEGTFVYKLEFRLQTQVGSPHCWIHLYVRCSRYVDEEMKRANWKRDITVRVGIDRPRLPGWNSTPTLVSLPVAGGAANPRWEDDPVQLLSAMNARDLVSPVQILQKPQDYRKASSQSNYDEYYVVHAEGFRPSHEVKTGFDFAELQEVANAVENILELELSRGQTLVSDTPTAQMYLNRLPLMMYDISDLRKKQFAKKKVGQTETENNQQNRSERQRIILQALQRASRNQNVFILLCWQDEFSKSILEQEVRQTLFLDTNAPWPDNIKLLMAPAPLSNDLLKPLDSGLLNPMDHFKKNVPYADRQKFKRAWKMQMRKAFREKTQAWEGYLRSLLPDEPGYGLVLIELRPLNEIHPEKLRLLNEAQPSTLQGSNSKLYHLTQNIKGAVRRACNKLGLASQMVFPMKRNREGEVSTTSKSRASNSVTDLVYRQTGLVYDQPVDLYIKAGLSQEQAEQLHVVALYKLRKYKPAVNYPMAVRLCPDSTFQALLPHDHQQWQPFLEARRVLGEIFMGGKEQDISLSPEAQAQFAAQIFTETRDVPTLVLLEATDWRNYNVLPQFANTTKLKDQLDLRHVKTYERLYAVKDLPHLRIIRLRTVGTSGETPQYFTVAAGEEDQLEEDRDISYLTGFVDSQAESSFFHYVSIGKLPITAKRQYQNPGLYKTDEGGGIAFKHQTIAEFVPFFLQEGDDPHAWCRIPHFMRTAPAWDGGNIVLPYPMHLAQRMIDDQLCILENNGDLEEGE